MAANSNRRGITVLGKRIANQIWTPHSAYLPHTSAPSPSARTLRRATYSSLYDKNLDEICPTVVPEDVIQAAHSDKYWAPHPQTGVFGPPTDHITPSTTARGRDRNFHLAPAAAAATASVLEEKAWFRHTGIEDLEKPHFLP